MSDYYFPSTDPLNLGTPAQKFQGNLEAIRILKNCTAEGRPATAEEQVSLARYTGWGDAAMLGLLIRSTELAALLSPEEMRAARGSALNAHYTALPVIGAIWAGLSRLGLSGSHLRILDPSAGIGHFKSCAPEDLRQANWIEVELDRLTAGILNLLHPASRVVAAGFETLDLPEAWFDLVVSNVPFGDYGVASRYVPAQLRASIHDFFFARAAALLRPGGVMALITSRYTLDKKENGVRQWLARRLDLLAAVRLPCNAFKANAGTEVVTDILFLQKRAVETRSLPDWVETVPVSLPGKYVSRNLPVNAYYTDHPEMILGMQALSGKMYESDGYNVEPDGRDLAEAIRAALSSALPENAACRATLPEVDLPETPEIITTAKPRSAGQEACLEGLHAIYRAAKAVLFAESQGKPAGEIAGLRQELNQVYDRFVSRFGPINRPGNVRILEDSVEMPFLKALEIYDPPSGTAQKAAIFSSPLVRSTVRAQAPTACDALLICLDQRGKVDLPWVASRTGLGESEVIQQLGERIFHLPDGGWETREVYLSGNVRAKLRAAQAAASIDPSFTPNVQALSQTLPEPLQPGQIRAPLGAGWVPAGIVQAFIDHLLSDGDVQVSYLPALAHWVIEARALWRIPSGLAFGRWGTSRMHALDLIDAGLNARTPVVYDNLEGGERVVNRVETVAAQAKLLEIRSEFERWLWSDPGRAAELAGIYNETFNAFVDCRYDGAHLSLPGLNRSIHLRATQKNAIWRILQNRATLLGHEVGMGKTLIGIAAIVEAKRLGLCRKAIVVVPNHLTAQWHAQALWAYPHLNILAVTSGDLGKAGRGAFLSRIATRQWDLVIVPFSAFKLLPVSPSTLAGFFQREIDRLEEYLWGLKAERASPRAIKEIEKSLKRFRVKLENTAEMARDSAGTITWEELGVDLLMVDEFVAFKNLYFHTRMNRIAGLANSDSQRAFDMFVKVRWILEHGGKVVGMTGTPITNTIAEMFTLQRFFQLETLEKLGLAHFDAWASQFALAEPGLEMTPDGSGFRLNTRFRKFVNVPELLKIWNQIADTQRIEPGCGIARPELWGQKPVRVVSSGGSELKAYTESLAARAERVRAGLVEPEVDNMLRITGDGRKAALDMSLVVPALPGAPMPKIDALVEIVAGIHQASQPAAGAQIIFCDLATPKARS